MCDELLITVDTFSWTVQLPNGQLVSCSKDKTIRFWDLATGATVKVLRGHSEYVRTLLLLSDGRIVSGSDDSTMRVWRYGFACFSKAIVLTILKYHQK
jgi:WD40 repeat protein